MDRIAFILKDGTEQSREFWFDVRFIPRIGEYVSFTSAAEHGGDIGGEVSGVSYYMGYLKGGITKIVVSVEVEKGEVARAHEQGIEDEQEELTP